MTINTIVQNVCEDTFGRPTFRIENHLFSLSTTNKDTIEALCLPDTADYDQDTNTHHWLSYADAYFNDDGYLAQHFGANYECRTPQRNGARLWQRAIETNQAAVIEAGTGTGKSFMALVPPLAMNKRIIISTSNKALQSQLMEKDLPFLCDTLFGGSKTFALSQGKSNFMCMVKADKNKETLSPEIAQWCSTTLDGNMEQLERIMPKDRDNIAIDDSCMGKKCALYDECHYYKAKANLFMDVDVIVTNHMLLSLHVAYPHMNILPHSDVIIVDEAHKLEDYVRKVVGAEFTINSIERLLTNAANLADEIHRALSNPQKLVDMFVEKPEEIDDPETDWYVRDMLTPSATRIFAMIIEELPKTQRELNAYTGAFTEFIGASTEYQIGIRPHVTIDDAHDLAEALDNLAKTVWDSEVAPRARMEVRLQRLADRIINMADNLRFFASHVDGFVRWIEVETLKSYVMPLDVSKFISEKICGIYEYETDEDGEPTPRVKLDHTHCTRCHRKLTAKTVAILDGQPFGPVCIRTADLLNEAEYMDLQEWLDMDHTPEEIQEPKLFTTQIPVLFTSATIGTPKLNGYLKKVGLTEENTLQMLAKSPFNYQEQTLFYVPDGREPNPKNHNFTEFCIDEIRTLVNYSEGGVFCLFTSRRAMKQCFEELYGELATAGYRVFSQDTYGKKFVIDSFNQHHNCVLFATESYFEGVSIDGLNLRTVILDKLPFGAPSPLSKAIDEMTLQLGREKGLTGDNLKYYPFNKNAIPNMITKTKQASGRLIRTATDQGVFALLDNRARTAAYGRNRVVPSLPFGKPTSHLYQVADFLSELILHADNEEPQMFADLTPIQQVGFVANGQIQEVSPFTAKLAQQNGKNKPVEVNWPLEEIPF